ncbi:hypothetical protein CHU98_g3624 [Xylaria longipes]|nr:hypothetical protein CHU98_g3624 [Xylaria longipes]
MYVPEEFADARVSEASDTLKAIATLQPTPLGALKLDDIGQVAHQGPLRYDDASELDNLLQSLVTGDRIIRVSDDIQDRRNV